MEITVLENVPITDKKIYLGDFEQKKFYKKIGIKISRFFYKISDFYYNIIEGFKSLKRWHKFAWNDRRWGYSNILNALIFKIEMDANAFEKRKHLSNTEEIITKMRRVTKLLKKWNDDNYYIQHSKSHDIKWGEDRHYFIELLNGTFEWKSERQDRLSEEDKVLERAEFRQCMDNVDLEKKQDIKEAFDILTNNIEYFWD